jgi:hypothetical protein
MTKYLCKVRIYEKYDGTEEDEGNYTLHIISEKEPCEVAEFLSKNAGQTLGISGLPLLWIPGGFKIPEIVSLTECKMYSTSKIFYLKYSYCDESETEIIIENIDEDYINVDIY